MKTTITIDGSYGEGGGQILRNACAYAAIIRMNIRIVNIRVGRKKPGLRPQHLMGLRLLAAASGSCIAQGDHIGSTEILFLVDNSKKKSNNDALNNSCDACNATTGDKIRDYVGDTQTAGSICLLLQSVLPFALFRGISNNRPNVGCDDATESLPIRFILKGGTDADMAPPLDFNRYVFLPTLQRYCDSKGSKIDVNNSYEVMKRAINLSVIRRGFYPRGGGEVHVAVRRLPFKALPWPSIRLTERGNVIQINIRAFAAGNCSISTAQILSNTAQKIIASDPSYCTVPITTDSTKETETSLSTSGGREKKRQRTAGSGCGILIIAETDKGCLLSGSALGSPKIPLVETAQMATKEVVRMMNGDGCVDDHLQDQLIIYMALAGGVSEVVTNSLTLHTRTAIWLASRMLPSVRFEVTKVGATEGGEEALLTNADLTNGVDTTIPGSHRIRCHGIGFNPLQ